MQSIILGQDAAIDTSSIVTSFKGRTGAVTPASGDYTAAMVGAATSDHTHSNYLPLTGGTLTGALTIGKMKISYDSSAQALNFEVV